MQIRNEIWILVMRFIFVFLFDLSRFDCRPSAEPPVARRPLLGGPRLSDNTSRPSSPQPAKKMMKKAPSDFVIFPRKDR